MGGSFRSPAPPPMPLLPLPLPPPPAPDPRAAERQQRIDAIARRRRGLDGAITTSARGLLGLADMAPYRKKLLGE